MWRGSRLRRRLRAAWLGLAPGSFLRHAAPDPEELGRAGERLVLRHLARAGWHVLARRLRTSRAEVDLVAEDGEVLVCVEVKTGRAGPRFRPGARLEAEALRRLRQAARLLARQRGRRRARVDLIEVLLGPAGPSLVHHRALEQPLAQPGGKAVPPR